MGEGVEESEKVARRVKSNCCTTSVSSRYIDIIEDEIKAVLRNVQKARGAE